MDGIDVRELLVKKPFTRVLSTGYLTKGSTTDNGLSAYNDEILQRQIVTQGDFLREYDPSGHAVNNPQIYKDVIKKDPETGKFYIEEVVRCSFAFQRVIATKHIMHLCGNDIQFELPNAKYDKGKEDLFFNFKQGWQEKNMETYFYNSVKSFKITGDVAYVGYMKDGKFGSRVFSFLNGDILFPHFDYVTGKITVFARKYNDYDEDGKAVTSWVEVWDDKYLYRFKQGLDGKGAILARIKGMFGLSGYVQVSKALHGFDFCPVSYYRDEKGACWSNSQDSCDQYEYSFSQLCQNNRAYAFPIMYFKGDDIEVQGDMDGAVKAVSLPSDGEAGFLQKQDASGSFNTQLEKLYKMIYEQSFCVIPPELKSGDLPGVAVKLLFSPAYENAFRDAQELNPFLQQMIKIFKAGYGMEKGKYTDYMVLEVNAWIEPYIHQNLTELITNLSQGVQNGYISKETASERASVYTRNNEWDRIIKEKKEEQQMDLLLQAKKDESQMQMELEKAKRLEKGNNGQDVNTNRQQGRPNKSGKDWDKNGNNAVDDKNNWEKWNNKK